MTVETRHPSEWLSNWPQHEPEFPLNGGWMIDHLFWAFWYNGHDGDVEGLASLLERADGTVTRSNASFGDDETMELLWMVLVQHFGGYGTSPRCGWVSDAKGAFGLLKDHIARTWGDDG
jgi:hypothetical protein